MLPKIILELAKKNPVIYTLNSNKPNWITKVEQDKLNVETESSREKYKTGEKNTPWETINTEFLLTAWTEFISVRKATSQEFIKTRGRSSFIMAFFSRIPFVDKINEGKSSAIQLREFQTDDIPCEQFNKVITFLDEIISGKYNPIDLSKQSDGNLYRIKSRARQDLRLLGILDEKHNINHKLLNQYTIETDKNSFLKTLMLQNTYMQITIQVLDLLGEYSKVEKKATLSEMAMLIARNSRGDNLMVESVAKERTHNLLMWFESVGVINEKWEPLVKVERNQESMAINYWWVNQGQTHKEEKEGGFLWAPQQSKNGRTVAHHKDLTKAKEGNIVFCYSSGELKSIGFVECEATEKEKPTAITSDNWHQDGYLVKLKYYDLTQAIRKDEIPEEWRLQEKGPFDVNGDVKQGYFYSVSDEFFEKLLLRFRDRFSDELLQLLELELEPEDEILLSPKELTDHIHAYISNKGFYYEKEEVINLYLSLKSKPFVILSGISGTGKTKIVQWLAESIGATDSKDNKQFKLISVRPDWNDGSDLLGYVDIKGDFKDGPLTVVIKEALKHPHLPYMVLLDEMNLARVEYYFSDILSVMETKRWENNQLVTSNLLSKEVAGFDMYLPANLYIVGTVNMDETTHPFSKKVLDRANTIEFNQINLAHFSFLHETVQNRPQQLGNSHLEGEYLYLKDVYAKHPKLVDQVTNELIEVNKILQSIGAHFGYRVRDEICFYLAYNEEGNLLSFNQAMDHCLLQKILPRLSGSDYRIQKVLEQLFKLCTNKVIQEDQEDFTEDIAFGKFPKSAEKLIEMRRRLLADGFTSFWISS